MRHEGADAVRQHLQADLSYQEKLVRFIENHDEPRATKAFRTAKPGPRPLPSPLCPAPVCFTRGSSRGRRIKLPVFLDRRPAEMVDADLPDFYRTLLAAVAQPVFKSGEWHLCGLYGWPDNRSYFNLAAWGWRLGAERRLIIVNLASHRSQALVPSPGRIARENLAANRGLHRTEVRAQRPGTAPPRLNVDLEGWGFHLFQVA